MDRSMFVRPPVDPTGAPAVLIWLRRVTPEAAGWVFAFDARATAPNDDLVAADMAILGGTSGRVDAFVSHIDNGGQFGAIASALKEQSSAVEVIAVETISTGLLMAPNRRELVDETLNVNADDIDTTVSRLANLEGLIVKRQSAANVAAAIKVAQRLGVGRVVVTVLTDE